MTLHVTVRLLAAQVGCFTVFAGRTLLRLRWRQLCITSPLRLYHERGSFLSRGMLLCPPRTAAYLVCANKLTVFIKHSHHGIV